MLAPQKNQIKLLCAQYLVNMSIQFVKAVVFAIAINLAQLASCVDMAEMQPGDETREGLLIERQGKPHSSLSSSSLRSHLSCQKQTNAPPHPRPQNTFSLLFVELVLSSS